MASNLFSHPPTGDQQADIRITKGADMNLRIWKTTLDCNDIEVVTTFWSRLLGLPVTLDASGNAGNFRNLGPEGSDPFADAVMCFQQVDEPRSGKNRMHLDLRADDLDAAVEEVCRHGGVRVSDLNEVPAGRWYVMADPEGNEFCLVSFST
jgi:predicted enzyme related to lactoylglutathione lyase